MDKADQCFYNDSENIPKVNVHDKVPRDLKHIYEPEIHPSRKPIYDFNNMEEFMTDFIDCVNSFQRHPPCN